MLSSASWLSVLFHSATPPPLSLHYSAVSGLLSPVVNHNKLRTRNDQVAFKDYEFPQCMKTIRHQEPGQTQLKILTALKKRKVWQRPRGSRRLPEIDPSSRQLGAWGRAVLWSLVLAEFSRDGYPPLFQIHLFKLLRVSSRTWAQAL